MVYYNRRRYGSRRRYRRGYRPSYNFVRRVANRVVASKTEKKYITDTLGDAGINDITTTPEQIDLASYISQGDNISERIADRIRYNNFWINGTLNAADGTNQIRMSLILADTDYDCTADGYSLSQDLNPRLNAKIRYVYFDKLFYLDGTVGPQAITFRRTVRLNLKQEYVSTTVKNYNVFLVLISDSGAAPDPGFVNGSLGVSFIDL